MKNSKMLKTYYFKKLGSTNDKAREIGNCVVIAETQSKGRGRFNKKWESPKGGLWMSISFSPRIDNPKKLTFITAISIQKIIKRKFGADTRIKWPNDLIFKEKKLCGILTDAVFSNKIKTAVIGIGLNVNNDLPLGLRRKAVSLKDITKKKIGIKHLAGSITKEFFLQYRKYNKKNKKLLNDLKQLSDTIGRKVRVKTLGGSHYGIAESIDEDGNLILKLKDGARKKITEGNLY